MGASGELQYGLPFVMIFVLIKFIIINFKINSFKKYAFIIAILYTIAKVAILMLFNFEIHIIQLQVFTTILIITFLILQFYIFNKGEKCKERKQLLIEVKFGYIYGIIMVLFPLIVLLLKLNIYNNQVENLVLISIEFIMVGSIYIIATFLGTKKFEELIDKSSNRSSS